MGVTCLNGKELDPDEKAPKNSEKNIEEFKPESDRDITVLELEMEFEKMIKKFPLNLDAIRGESTSRYWLESSPHGSDLDLASFSNLLNSIKNLGWRSPDSGEYQSSFSLNLLNKTLSSFNFPLNLSLSELILLRRTRSFFSERSVIDSIANVVLSHSAWWKLDAFQENTKALSNTSSKKSKSESSSPDEEASEVKFPKMKIISPPSSKSSFSWQSTSSANSSITRGQLQCFQNGGMLYFIFSLDDAPQVIYMASPQKIKSSAENSIDGMYLFYSKGSNNGDSRNLIAKMKVSSSIVLTPNRLKIMETEFVLYDYRDELSNKPQNSSSVVSRSKGFPRKFAERFRQSNMVKIKPNDKVNKQNFDGLGEDAVDVLLPNLELAAIVVQDCFHDAANGGLMFGGWGLKFLEKAGQKDASLEPSLHPCSSKNRSDRDKSARRMNVLIPADRHGGLVSRHGGPASIVARWRSGGRCDCGGWDIGCPLTVLNHSSVYSSASTKDTDKKTVNLLMEGTNNGGHPTLSMMKMSEGLYSICFQSSLSVLQSFSIAVAAVHKNC